MTRYSEENNIAKNTKDYFLQVICAPEMDSIK